ncbi:hypothetical protein XA68_11078 [Ophiocordyceps unilateralis]|uniref:Uncharacterized protein n=1 Tax=Ophiocordyceps unilateralis TaxID=268505 RepID=A0A2A9PHT5_OPHUN|nr:hypothetical protein XA68_11078 [Ophiocordyceps unilateralis]
MGELLETADEYGRRSRCFRDHRKNPFRFKHHLADIHASALETAPDGFVKQSDLGSCCFPEPTETWEDSMELEEELLSRLCLFPSQPWRLPNLKELRVPVEELDLGTLPELDMQQTSRDVFSKRHCRLACTWIPLSSVCDERDEGLMFSFESAKLQSLLLRKAELETIAPSTEASDFENYSAVGPSLSLICKVILYRRQPDSPCAPGSTPDQVDGAIDPVGSDIFVTTPQGKQVESTLGQELEPSHPNAQDVALEVPLITTSSDAVCEPDAAGNIHLPKFVDVVDSPSPTTLRKDGALDEVLTCLLSGRDIDPTSMAEQERLNPTDPIARVPVPVLDFRLPRPDWTDKAWGVRQHFLWLQASSPDTYQIPLLPIDGRLNRSLKWALFSGGSAASFMAEELQLSSESKGFSTTDKASQSPESVRFIWLPRTMAILQMDEDEDAELQESMAESSKDFDNAFLRDDDALRGDEGFPQPCANSNAHPVSLAPCRGTADRHSTLLPDSSDPNATSQLLSGFMELRAVKRRRISSPRSAPPTRW